MLAYLTAARCNIEAAVSYYGVGIEKRLDEVGAVRCPLMLHFGEQDRSVPAAAREAVAVASSKDREGVEIYVYPGADHAFNNAVRPSYHRFLRLRSRTRTRHSGCCATQDRPALRPERAVESGMPISSQVS